MKAPSIFNTVLLSTFGAFAVAGVLVFALFVGKGNTTSLGAMEVWGTLDEAAFGVITRQASENGSPLGQVTYVQKDPKTFEATITNALASGEGPDLFLLRHDQILRNAGKIAPISFEEHPQTSFESTFIDASRSFFSETGATGIPLFSDPLVLYWNKDILATAGYAEPPKYWDEILAMAPKVTTKDESGSIRRATIALGEYQNITNAKDILATLIIQAGGAITARTEDGTVVSKLASQGTGGQPAVSALRFYTEFADPSKEIYSWSRSLPEAQRSFAGGDVALYIGYASEHALIRKANPNLNYGVAVMPQIRSNPVAVNTARVYGLAASRTGKNTRNAITVAFMFAEPDVAAALSKELGITSARRDLLNKRDGGDSGIFNTQAIIAKPWLDPNPEGTADIFRAMIENTTSGAMLVSESVQRGSEELEQVLGI